MTSKNTILDLETKTEEAEETKFVPEAKQVEACDFQSQKTGSSPVWDADVIVGKRNKDITGFNWTMKQDMIDGRIYSRLSFQT